MSNLLSKIYDDYQDYKYLVNKHYKFTTPLEIEDKWYDIYDALKKKEYADKR